jgi:hypothetical protein
MVGRAGMPQIADATFANRNINVRNVARNHYTMALGRTSASMRRYHGLEPQVNGLVRAVLS